MAQKRKSTKGKRSETSVAKVARTKSKVKGMFVERDGITYTFAGVVDDEGVVTTEAYPVEFYVRDVLNGTICTNVMIQRRDDQWDGNLKSQLIFAMFKERPIGSILLTERNKYTRYYEDNSVIDGLQRTSAIVGFINNEYCLSKSIPSIRCRYADENSNIIEATYQLAGRKFEQLPEILQNKLLRYQLTVCVYKNFTDDALDKIMFCVNSGKPLSPYNKLRLELGSANTSIVQPMCESTLWEDISINLKNDSELACVIRIMMLLSYNTSGGFNVAAMKKFVGGFETQKNSLVEKVSALIEQFAEIKYNMTDKELEILDGCNIPHFISALKNFNNTTSKGKNIHNKTFLEFFRAFLKSKEAKIFFAYKAPKNNEEKDENKKNGSGGSQYSADSIDSRESAISNFMDIFFDMPLIESNKNFDVNTDLEVNSDVQTEQSSKIDTTGEFEYTNNNTETENDAVLNTNNFDMQGDFESGRDTGGDRLENEAEYRETKILSGDSVQIGIAVPFNSGYNDIHECVQAGQQTQ